MEYNEKIAKITGQDLINHNILYDMNNTNYAIYKIIGEAGTGKRTLCEHIVKSWLSQSKGEVFYFFASYHQTPEDYSTFKHLITRSKKGKKILNLFKVALKDVPYLGNSLSAIASEIIENIDKKGNSKDYTENEDFIFSAIKKLSHNKDVLFLCFDYELWDLKSQHILYNLLKYIKHNLGQKKSHFIFITEHKHGTLLNTKMQKEYLNKIQKEDIPEVIQQFNSSMTLNKNQINQLFELTEGNLEFIKESLEILQTNDFPIEHSLYNIIEMKISSLCNKSQETLELLKQAAFIGSEMDSRLLKIFSDIASDIYEQILDEAIKHFYLKEENYTIYFIKKYVYSIMRDCLLKDRQYYLRLYKCLNALYPSRYDLQIQYLYRGNLTNQADRLFMIYLIGFYRENNMPFEINYEDNLRLSSNPLYTVYKQICTGYQLYKSKNYDEAENELSNIYCEDVLFRFEKDYLLSLIVTNKYYTFEEFEERINTLSTYITDSFLQDYPEMYLRAQMMLAEFYAETSNDKELRICLKAIQRYFNQYATTDRKIQCYEHCFKMKANAFYKIEIAWKYTRDALYYFSQEENNQMYLSKYYLAILNHSANEIVIGNYEEAFNMLLKAKDIVCQNSQLKDIHEDILINNMAISGFLGNVFHASDCIITLKNIIHRNTEAADSILLKNNLAVFYAIEGYYKDALAICQLLYQKMEFNDDIDEYYRYYILNNYGIILWINQEQEEAERILDEAFSLQPLPKDIAYFKARSEKILSLLKNTSIISIIKKDREWNSSLYKENTNVVGKAWKYWSSLMLFSELQIWSDF